MRSDDSVQQQGRTYVPVLSEFDYYRAEANGVEAFAMLVPIDRVWVESLGTETGPSHAVTALDAPGPRVAIPVTTAGDVLGRRLIQAVPDGYARDIRAATSVYTNGHGNACVRVCAESAWYQWAFSGELPRTTEVAAADLWTE
jgi:hypothetical protein